VTRLLESLLSVLVAIWTVVGVLVAVVLIHLLFGKFHMGDKDEFQ
jgi:hypothetical protein